MWGCWPASRWKEKNWQGDRFERRRDRVQTQTSAALMKNLLSILQYDSCHCRKSESGENNMTTESLGEYKVMRYCVQYTFASLTTLILLNLYVTALTTEMAQQWRRPFHFHSLPVSNTSKWTYSCQFIPTLTQAHQYQSLYTNNWLLSISAKSNIQPQKTQSDWTCEGSSCLTTSF